MDINPTLKSAAKRILEGLQSYALQKGWPPESYYVSMSVNTNWGTFLVELISAEFDHLPINDHQAYEEVMDFLESNLKDDSELFDSVYLVLEPLRRYSPSIQRDYGENTVEIDEEFLNPGKKPLRDWASHS